MRPPSGSIRGIRSTTGMGRGLLRGVITSPAKLRRCEDRPRPSHARHHLAVRPSSHYPTAGRPALLPRFFEFAIAYGSFRCVDYCPVEINSTDLNVTIMYQEADTA